MFSVIPPDEDETEDGKLVAKTLAGERDAFAVLVERYQRSVLGIAYRLSRDRVVAQDLAQEAFWRAFRSLCTFDQSRPFAPWLHRIVTNLGLNWLKRKRLPTVLLEASDQGIQVTDASPGPEDVMLEAEFHAWLWEAVAALPPEFRSVIELRHARQLSYQAIADKLDIPLSSVKSRLFRARQQLRKSLESDKSYDTSSDRETTGPLSG